MRNVLMIAYVFPPFFSIGGSIRVVKFIKYLPSLGWRPLVLTISDQEETVSQRRVGSEDLLKEIPVEARIFRTSSGEPSAGLQAAGRAARQRSRWTALIVNFLSWLRRMAYRYLLLPDAHITWLPAAVRCGRRLVFEEEIEVIWVTCPPHSSVLIGACLKLLTGKPLVLDYRDDWIDTPWFQAKPRTSRWLEQQMEWLAVRLADRVVSVTEASRSAFIGRYPNRSLEVFKLVPNGCDLESFAPRVSAPEVSVDRKFLIVHAGLLSNDPGWHRSPRAFFSALRKIASERPDVFENLEVTFTGRLPEIYRNLLGENGLGKAIRESGFLPEAEFQRLLQDADLLLVINYEGFRTLIPGKIYEYWAIGRAPMLLLDDEGAATRLVKEQKLGFCATHNDIEGTAAVVVDLYERREAGYPLFINRAGIERFDRRALSGRLAELLSEVCGSPS